MLDLGKNNAWCLRVTANRTLESTNYTHENIGAGLDFRVDLKHNYFCAAGNFFISECF
jgi:hypothetical protein